MGFLKGEWNMKDEAVERAYLAAQVRKAERRERIATEVLKGLCISDRAVIGRAGQLESYPVAAVQLADALIRELDEPPPRTPMERSAALARGEDA